MCIIIFALRASLQPPFVGQAATLRIRHVVRWFVQDLSQLQHRSSAQKLVLCCVFCCFVLLSCLLSFSPSLSFPISLFLSTFVFDALTDPENEGKTFMPAASATAASLSMQPQQLQVFCHRGRVVNTPRPLSYAPFQRGNSWQWHLTYN